MSQAPAGGRDAVEKLFRHPELSMESLPVLKDAFTTLASDCGEGIRALCPHPMVFAVAETGLCKASEVLDRYQNGVAYIFHANGWGTQVVIGIERATMFLLVESVFGGDGSEELEVDERPFSKLELRLGQKVAALAAASLNQFLSGISAIDLVLDRVEPAISSAMLGQAETGVAHARIDIQLLDRRGKIFIMIPRSGIYPLRSKLERLGGHTSALVDEDWTNRLKEGVESTTVSLRAVIQAHSSTLREVAAFKVGSVIEFPLDAQNNVIATCNGSQVFTARLVQSKGHYALAINTFADGSSN
ncbi:MAG: flagellar motor switch protein FliM [Alphaproteobacteria bacterium]|nr:flagellar motor switch protein FliM [Alphaproteobacteria bacterium]